MSEIILHKCPKLKVKCNEPFCVTEIIPYTPRADDKAPNIYTDLLNSPVFFGAHLLWVMSSNTEKAAQTLETNQNKKRAVL